jgi:membrane-bound serine protease (ClpP class)
MMLNDIYLAYFLVALGLILMAAELMLPTGGILFVLGVAGLIAAVAMLFLYDGTQALITLVALFVLLPIAGHLLLQWWPRTAVGRQFVLPPGADEDATVAAMPVNLELEQLRGHHGRTASPLRPAGVTEFDGRRVDTLSEGPFIEAGKWVRCIDVRAGKVIVREVEAPPGLADLEFDHLT